MHNYIKNKLQKYRLSVIAIFIFFAISFLDIMFRIDLVNILFPKIRYSSFEIYIVLGPMIALGLFLNIYLHEDESVNSIQHININNTSDNVLISNLQKKIEQRLEQLELELSRKSTDSLSEKQRNELVYAIKQQFLEISSEELINDLKEKNKKVIDDDSSQRLKSHFSRIMQRLLSQIALLDRRSRVNLIIGSLSAFAGVSILIIFVLEKISTVSVETYFVTEFAPRISLIIIIEIFAYFFLGLYKSNLSEIKYFHNELTNVEHKYMALEEALASTSQKTVIEVVKDLSKTERNFLLKKGETTVSLEERRYTQEEQSGVVNALINKLSKN